MFGSFLAIIIKGGKIKNTYYISVLFVNHKVTMMLEALTKFGTETMRVVGFNCLISTLTSGYDTHSGVSWLEDSSPGFQSTE